MGKNQSASGLTNVIQYSNGNITFVSGSTTLMSISSSGAITTTGVISGSNVLTASYANNAELLDGLDSTAFATTGAYSATSGSLYTVSSSAYATSGSLSTASGSFNTRVSALEATGSALSSSILSVSSSAYATSGSLSATSGSLSAASGSSNTRVSALEVTGSALSSSILSVSSSAYATSGSLSTDSGSFNSRVASLETYSTNLTAKTASFATTGSNTFIGSQVVSGSLTASGSITATGTITAQTLVVQTITSSVVYSSGSNVFGNDIGNSQVFTGSMFITGSNMTANVSNACFAGSIQSSMLCSSTINLTGNNNTLACNNTLRFTDTDTATEANQQIGKIEFYSSDVTTPGAGVKAYIGAFAADTSPDAYLSFATQDGSATPDPVERLRISSEGAATFSSTITGTTIYGSTAVCSPVGKFTSCIDAGSATFSGCVGIGTVSPIFSTYAQLTVKSTTAGGIVIQSGATDYSRLFFAKDDTSSVEGLIRYYHCDNSMQFYTSGGDRMRITSGGLVNILSDSTNTTFTNSGTLAIKNAASEPFMSWHSNTGTRLGFIQMQSAGTAYFSVQVAQALAFDTSGTERMRITSTGIASFACQVCAPSFNSTSTSYLNGLVVSCNVSSNCFTGITVVNSAGGGSECSRAGIAFQSYDWVQSAIWHGRQTSAAFEGALLFGTNPNTANLGVGGVCTRLRIDNTGIACFACQVCAPSGVKFGNGATTLNYYEQGTWTPVIKFGGNSVGQTYGAQVGTYTKIGNTVTISIGIEFTAKGSSTGTATLAGLPFAAANTNNAWYGLVYAYTSLDFGKGRITTNNSIVDWDIADSAFTNTSYIYASATYKTL